MVFLLSEYRRLFENTPHRKHDNATRHEAYPSQFDITVDTAGNYDTFSFVTMLPYPVIRNPAQYYKNNCVL
jgi:hypothetical protein